MRNWLSSLVVIFCMMFVDTAHAEVRGSMTLGPDTKLTPIRIVKGDVERRKVVKRSDVVKSRRFTAVVVASWCSASQDLLQRIAAKEAPTPDLIIFADDEVTGLANRAIREGADKAAVLQWLDERRAAGDMLADPESVEHKLSYYVVPTSSLANIGHYPTHLVCDAGTCIEPSRSDRLKQLLKQLEERR